MSPRLRVWLALAAVGGLLVGGAAAFVLRPTKTHTISQPVTPTACIAALNGAEDALHTAVDAAAASGNVMAAQNRALQSASDALSNPAGVTQADVDQMQSLSATIETETDDIQAATDRLNTIRAKYTTDAAACRGSR